MVNEDDKPGDPTTPEADSGRRKFFTKIILSVGGLVGTVLALPLLTAMLDPVTRRKERVWREVGKTGDFTEGETTMVTFENASPYKWSDTIARTAAYLRREPGDKFTAFSINCAHLGCPVRWEAKAELFLCPCHGGVYYKDGSRAAGPPPKGLSTYPVRVKGGVVEIETTAIPITNMSS